MTAAGQSQTVLLGSDAMAQRLIATSAYFRESDRPLGRMRRVSSPAVCSRKKDRTRYLFTAANPYGLGFNARTDSTHACGLNVRGQIAGHEGLLHVNRRLFRCPDHSRTRSAMRGARNARTPPPREPRHPARRGDPNGRCLLACPTPGGTWLWRLNRDRPRLGQTFTPAP